MFMLKIGQIKQILAATLWIACRQRPDQQNVKDDHYPHHDWQNRAQIITPNALGYHSA
jgi:hypothetical protein